MRGRRSVEKRLVWIFGSPRSGSTWLLNLLGAGGSVVKLDEPAIGTHLSVLLDGFLSLQADAPPRYRLNEARAEDPDYFLSREFEPVWRPALRRLVLDRLVAQLGRARLAAIKEPHGSHGADLVMSLLPRSRLIFLLRDGRDVIDSELDAATPGSWAMKRAPGFAIGDRMSYIRARAHHWLWRTEIVQRAFDAHPVSLRRLVRYEALRADPASVLRPLAGWLDLDPAKLLEAAESTAFERLSPGQRGSGRFTRAAEPGRWRTGLRPQEQDAVHGIIGAKLRELDYET